MRCALARGDKFDALAKLMNFGAKGLRAKLTARLF
jgi:hypothetical protein